MANLSTEKQIASLADADLCAIFERLPPLDRLIASEVCRRWHDLVRKPWLDVTELDFSSIPGKHLGAIVRQCTNLRTVFATKKSFDLNELAILCKSSCLSAVKLYDCNFAVKSDLRAVNDGFAKLFSQSLQHATWNELVLHDARFDEKNRYLEQHSSTRSGVLCCMSALSIAHVPKWAFSAAHLPASLTRLQLTGLWCFRKGAEREHCANVFLAGLEQLQNLECLILHQKMLFLSTYLDPDDFIRTGLLYDTIGASVCALKNLRELFVGPAFCLTYGRNFGRLTSSLPKLEVLFLSDVNGVNIADDLKELITRNVILRVLCLSGEFLGSEPIEIPARTPFPAGIDCAPLPLLHIFIGKKAAERLQFAGSSSDVALIHPINKPLVQFLEQEDISPIFEGVWVFDKIKETAKSGSELWSHELY